MPELTKEGRFRAVPVEWAVKQADNSTAIQFNVKYTVLAERVGNSWEEYDGSDFVWGYHNLVKKDETLNEKQVESIAQALGWNGNLVELQTGDWSNIEVEITVGQERDDKGNLRYRAQWMNAQGGGIARMDDERLNLLSAKFGSKFEGLIAAKNAKGGRPVPVQHTPRVADVPVQPVPQDEILF